LRKKSKTLQCANTVTVIDIFIIRRQL